MRAWSRTVRMENRSEKFKRRKESRRGRTWWLTKYKGQGRRHVFVHSFTHSPKCITVCLGYAKYHAGCAVGSWMRVWNSYQHSGLGNRSGACYYPLQQQIKENSFAIIKCIKNEMPAGYVNGTLWKGTGGQGRKYKGKVSVEAIAFGAVDMSLALILRRSCDWRPSHPRLSLLQSLRRQRGR